MNNHFYYEGLVLTLLPTAMALCFFNEDMQGEYVTQRSSTSGGAQIAYSDITVLRDSIPVWGLCHRRFGNNVILIDMAGQTECMRCFYMIARSTRVLEVYTEGVERCYINEGAALTRCPTEDSKTNVRWTQIMMFKVRDLVGRSESLSPVYCPLEGEYLSTYDLNDGTEKVAECEEPTVRVSNCMAGNVITIQFHGCAFRDFDVNFECLGSWVDQDHRQYLALRDLSVDKRKSPGHLKALPIAVYRCAIIEKERTGEIYLTFSSDSTCTSNLRSARDGFESFVLESRTPLQPPVAFDQRLCEFPEWAVRGKWEEIEVERNRIRFRDLDQLQSFTIRCVGFPSFGGLIYPVHSFNQCQKETFSCLVIKRRSANVMEFQLRENESSFSEELCTETLFNREETQWKTQSRVDTYFESPCPVAGEYIGVVPGDRTLCAKLYSDCNNLEIMFYIVHSCFNKSLIYDEREYRCLGQWVEDEITYTYTERIHTHNRECFVGVVKENDEILILESGSDCQRGLNPLANGMKLMKQDSCDYKSRDEIMHVVYEVQKKEPGSPHVVVYTLDGAEFSGQQIPTHNLYGIIFLINVILHSTLHYSLLSR